MNELLGRSRLLLRDRPSTRLRLVVDSAMGRWNKPDMNLRRATGSEDLFSVREGVSLAPNWLCGREADFLAWCTPCTLEPRTVFVVDNKKPRLQGYSEAL
jgi:hypothetical protein